MDLNRWHRHAWLNRLQTVLLLAFMAGFLALLGWLLWGLEGMLQLLVVGAVLALLNPVASPWLVLRLYRARPLPEREAPGLFSAVAELAHRTGLPSTPALNYVPSQMVNAFAVGTPREAAIAVTDGLLRTLNQREIVAVLAHEVSHIRNDDVWVMGLADMMSRLTNALSLFGQLLLIVNLPLILWSGIQIGWTAIALLVFAPQLSLLAQMGLSRAREYDADLNAVLLTGDPQGLASALAKIERRHRSFLQRLMLPGWGLPEPSWLRTHPPTGERIRRLLALDLEGAGRLSAQTDNASSVWTSGPGIARRPRYHASGLWY